MPGLVPGISLRWASLIGMNAGAIPQEKFYSLVPTAFIAVMVITRVTVRRLPKFLE